MRCFEGKVRRSIGLSGITRSREIEVGTRRRGSMWGCVERWKGRRGGKGGVGTLG